MLRRSPARHWRGRHALSDLDGKVVVINVWGSWCAPCRAETPDLVRAAEETASQGVAFLGINTRDNPAAARAFVRSFKVPYPSVEDAEGQLLLNFRGTIPTSVVPTTVVIDRQGKVAARVIGPVSYSTLRGILDDETTVGQPCIHAPRHARHVEMSAPPTLTCTSTAGAVQTPVAIAKRLATGYWPPWGESDRSGRNGSSRRSSVGSRLQGVMAAKVRPPSRDLNTAPPAAA